MEKGRVIMEFLGLVLTATIAAAAWLYQRAWERQEKRVARYQEVMNRLPSFIVGNLNQDGLDEVIAEHRRLWLSAPDDVIIAGENFLDAVEGRPLKNEISPDVALGEYVLAMRRDASMKSAILPRFWKTKLEAKEFRLRSASR